MSVLARVGTLKSLHNAEQCNTYGGSGPWTWQEAKSSRTVSNVLNAILGAFRDDLFGDAEGQEGDHRITLFQYRRTCWRAIWQRGRPPWGGWLVPVARPGRYSQLTRALFRAPDDPSRLEGVAGLAWGANRKVHVVLDLPDLSNLENPVANRHVKEYAERSSVSPQWVVGRVTNRGCWPVPYWGSWSSGATARHGVLVVDSRNPHVNLGKINEEWRDLCKRSLTHIVAEL